LGSVAKAWTASADGNSRSAIKVVSRGLPSRVFTFPLRDAGVLTDANARLGADVDRYSFIVVGLHHLLLAGLPAHFESFLPSQAVGSLPANMPARCFGQTINLGLPWFSMIKIGQSQETHPTAPLRLGVSLASHPGKNLTGWFLDLPELGGKQIELLKEAVPRLSSLGFLWDSTIGEVQFRATESASSAAGVTLQSLPIQRAEELEATFGPTRCSNGAPRPQSFRSPSRAQRSMK
jgi:hypothetical protein